MQAGLYVICKCCETGTAATGRLRIQTVLGIFHSASPLLGKVATPKTEGKLRNTNVIVLSTVSLSIAQDVAVFLLPVH